MYGSVGLVSALLVAAVSGQLSASGSLSAGVGPIRAGITAGANAATSGVNAGLNLGTGFVGGFRNTANGIYAAKTNLVQTGTDMFKSGVSK